ncbi:unnamed protein product [Auanema sp. JU1783]|nr:unnamed protein product [Auanema sp. JU1783]
MSSSPTWASINQKVFIKNRFHGLSNYPVSYDGAADYADQVRKWLFQTRCWQAVLQSAVPFPVPPNNNQNINATPINQQNNNTIVSINGRRLLTGTYKMASLPRRALAELIDWFLLFSVKILGIYWLISFDALDLSPYEKLIGKEADMQSFINATQDVFPLEMVLKVFGSILEAIFLSYGYLWFPPGASPGKIFLNLKVISAHTVIPTANPMEVIVTGDEKLPFLYSLLRSLVKNMIVNMLLPVSSILFGFQYNRAVYDLLAKTIVVEA